MPTLTHENPTGGDIAPPRWPGGFDGDGRSGDPAFSRFPLSKGELGMWVLIVVIVMLFAGLSSAYIVLRGAPTWQNIALPQVLWLNTALLFVSSFTLEYAKRAVRQNSQRAVRNWIVASALLGVAFLAGQLLAWRQLVAAGVYLPTTLQSSFFYVLTALHGVHLIGGIAGFGIALSAAFRGQLQPGAHTPLKVCALYWHAMDLIWIYLFMLLILT
ncbi:MAG TPA: cytochrome c oxidase subunit 3 [Terriglobia bacterium]|nr:cytochrome c oxidase subunit 3 [Terriglobia bacterium]